MLATQIREALKHYAARPALYIEGHLYTYAHLEREALSLTKVLGTIPRTVAIMAEHSVPAYAAVLATTLSGHCYVPLNSSYPARRLLDVLERCKADVIVVDRRRIDQARAVLASLRRPITVILPEFDAVPSVFRHAKPHTVLTAANLKRASAVKLPATLDDTRALYLMFTSGTTGEPKGIVISRNNVAQYLDATRQLFDFNCEDRFTQFFRPTFDLSVHDMFVAWSCGACLYVPTPQETIDPVAFARRHDLTVWFSVPSLATLAKRFGKLREHSLPALRHVLFCGEALSWEVARAFQKAAPKAKLSNLYGPTEATIAITKFDPSTSDYENSSLEAVPIGHPFPNQEVLVLDERLRQVAPGHVGELCLGGRQLARGYFNNEQQTADRFVHLEVAGRQCTRWYRTGDLVQEHPRAGLVFRGRKDEQIKLRGHRIEVTEVEEALRQAAETGFAVAAPWPMNGLGVAETLVAFVCKPHAPQSVMLDRLEQCLPSYMLPSKIVSIDDVSFNVNHKLDRAEIVSRYGWLAG